MITLGSAVGGSKDAAAEQKLLLTKMFPSFAKINFFGRTGQPKKILQGSKFIKSVSFIFNWKIWEPISESSKLKM